MARTRGKVAAAEDATRPVRRVALGQSNEDEEVIETDGNLQPSPRADVKLPREVLINESRAVNRTGEMITRQTRSVGTVTATAR